MSGRHIIILHHMVMDMSSTMNPIAQSCDLEREFYRGQQKRDTMAEFEKYNMSAAHDQVKRVFHIMRDV